MNLGSPNQIAALPPWLAGYEMADDHVAVIAFTMDDERHLQLGPGAILPCDELGADLDVVARETAQRFTHATEDSTSVFAFAIGHGPNGDVLADRVAAALPAGLPDSAPVVAMHNDGQTVHLRAPGGGWADFGPPADLSAEMTAAGKPQPAASRAMSDRLWEPDPVPSYPQLPEAERARLDTARPSQRAEAAVELLTDLAEGRAQDVPTTQSRLAALMSSDSDHWVQDRVMMAAVTAETPQMADELRRLYVQAPGADQQAIGGTAAVAAYAQHGNSQALRAMRENLDETGPGAEDARILDSLAQGLPEPNKFRAAVATAASRALDDGLPHMKDEQWQQARPRRPGTGADGPATPPRSPGPDHGRPRPGAPGPEDLPPGTTPGGPSMS